MQQALTETKDTNHKIQQILSKIKHTLPKTNNKGG